jgi:cysteine desulfurase/selenocysteine lyase
MAGVPDVAQLLGAAAASVWWAEHEEEQHQQRQRLVARLLTGLQSIPGISILGPEQSEVKTGVVSFRHLDFAASDIALVLAQRGVDCRAGRHCADILYEFLGVPESVRLSVAAYNTEAEIDTVLEIIHDLPRVLWRG